MTVQDIFGLVLRIAGAGLIVAGYLDLFPAAAVLVGVAVPARYSVSVDSLAALDYMLPGLALLFGADAVTWLAYRRRR